VGNRISLKRSSEVYEIPASSEAGLFATAIWVRDGRAGVPELQKCCDAESNPVSGDSEQVVVLGPPLRGCEYGAAKVNGQLRSPV
jgi:hypothetical protein